MSINAQFDKTERGFARMDFTDRYGVKCSIQKSSLATEDAIWFGCNESDPKVLVPNEGWQPVQMPKEYIANTRMHLTQEQVTELLPYLQYFAEHGEIIWPEPIPEPKLHDMQMTVKDGETHVQMSFDPFLQQFADNCARILADNDAPNFFTIECWGSKDMKFEITIRKLFQAKSIAQTLKELRAGQARLAEALRNSLAWSTTEYQSNPYIDKEAREALAEYDSSIKEQPSSDSSAAPQPSTPEHP